MLAICFQVVFGAQVKKDEKPFMDSPSLMFTLLLEPKIGETLGFRNNAF